MKLRCVAVACVLLAAAGCGQKGPLYRPGDPSQGRVVLPAEELPGANGEDEAGPLEEEPTADPTGPGEPPVEDPPVEDPPVEDPPVEDPPVEDDEQSGEQ